MHDALGASWAWLPVRLAEAAAYYAAVQLAHYVYHRWVHRPSAGILYRWHHIQHHKQQFPLCRLRALTYGAPRPSTAMFSAAPKAPFDSPKVTTDPEKPVSSEHEGQISESNVAAAVAVADPTSIGSAHEQPTSDGWFATGGEIVFGAPMAALAGVAWCALPARSAALFISIMLGTAVWGDMMHSSFHLTDDAVSHPESLAVHRWLVRQPWFKRCRDLHDLHHARTTTNFGFFDFTWDRVFGTYRTEAPHYLNPIRLPEQ